MTKHWLFGGLAVALAVLGAPARAGEPDTGEIKRPGQWDAKAVYLWPGPTDLADAPDGERIAAIPSPDHRFTLRIRENALTLLGPDGTAIAQAMDIEDLAEVSWAPDSKAFAVTESDGGWVGSWTATVYAVDLEGIQKHDVSSPITTRFQARKDGCDEIPNVAAAGWLGPDRILIVAEAPPHSSCKDMGTLRGYEFSIHNGQIAHEYSAGELRARFESDLGPRLEAQ